VILLQEYQLVRKCTRTYYLHKYVQINRFVHIRAGCEKADSASVFDYDALHAKTAALPVEFFSAALK
jgi:hypothetical protein